MVREDGCAIEVAVAVDSINSVNNGNLKSRAGDFRLEVIDKFRPVSASVAPDGSTTSTTEYTYEDEAAIRSESKNPCFATVVRMVNLFF